MSPAAISDSVSKVSILNVINYPQWAFAMKMVLVEKGLWHVVGRKLDDLELESSEQHPEFEPLDR